MRVSGMKFVLDENASQLFSSSIPTISMDLADIILERKISGDIIVTLYCDVKDDSVKFTFCCEQLVDNDEILDRLVELVEKSLHFYPGSIGVNCNGSKTTCEPTN